MNIPKRDKSDEWIFKIFCQIAKLVASRNHMAGYDLSYELFKSAYDIEFYSGLCIWSKVEVDSFVLSEDPENENYQTLAARLWPQYLVCLSHFFLPIISIYKVQDREKEDAFPLYFEDMMTGHWAGSYYRLLHNNSITNF